MSHVAQLLNGKPVGGRSAPVAETSPVRENRPETCDADLLRQAAAGDNSAFRQLMDRHADRMFRLASTLTGSATEAEDVLQEALIGAFKGARQFQGRSSVKTWLTRILLTQAARWQRDRRRRRLRQSDGMEEKFGVEGDAHGVEAKIDVRAAMRLLTSEHREVLVLREFDGLSYEEISAALGVPIGTVESRLHRARSDLKQKLKAYLP